MDQEKKFRMPRPQGSPPNRYFMTVPQWNKVGHFYPCQVDSILSLNHIVTYKYVTGVKVIINSCIPFHNWSDIDATIATIITLTNNGYSQKIDGVHVQSNSNYVQRHTGIGNWRKWRGSRHSCGLSMSFTTGSPTSSMSI